MSGKSLFHSMEVNITQWKYNMEIDLMSMEEEESGLEGLLGYPVDVVTEKGLRDRIRSRVLSEAIPL